MSRMRDTFVNFCLAKAHQEKKFELLTADLGFGIFDNFRARFPERFTNVGVAEQNLIGVATGMALSGLLPICYSLGNFPTMRCLEQIRNDAAYHNANILIVSSGGGFGYGPLGMSHHATEDVGIMSALPNVEVYVPASPLETSLILPRVFERPGVKYLRLEKTGEPFAYLNKNPLDDGYFLYRNGDDGLILSMGTTLSEALTAADDLRKKGLEYSVCSMFALKSSDGNVLTNISKLISRFELIFTVEEHNVLCGLGSYVCNIVATSDHQAKVVKVGLPDCYSSIVGDQTFLRDYYKINSSFLIDILLENSA